MTTGEHFVILGGGLTGHAAALAARHNGYDGDITIVSEEADLPYDRTPLSKAVLQGSREPDDLGFQLGGDYSADGITVLTGVTGDQIDVDTRRAVLSNGETLPWNEVLIATGARPVRLNQPGFDLENVHYLRTIPDAIEIRAGLEHAERVVVIGSGFIGSEVAASARTLGKEVTLVDMFPAPMTGALHPELARLCAGIHQDQGVDLRMNARVTALRGTGRVEEAILDDGTIIECDLVLVGVGVVPNIDVAQGTDIEIDNGIRVDDRCRANVPGVYAAGDVANWWHPELGRHIRIEHFDNAGAQGAHAGKVVAGVLDEPYAPVPYFWSDQYDVNIQYAGYELEDCDLVLRGSVEERAVTGFYLHQGAICAAVTINQAREFRAARRLVAARAVIEPEILRDPETDIRKISRSYR